MAAKIPSLALALGAVAPVALAEPVVLTEAQRDRAMAGGAKTLMTATTPMGSVALAEAPEATHAGMVQLTEAQLDQVTAGQTFVLPVGVGACVGIGEGACGGTIAGNGGPAAPGPDNNTNVPGSFHLKASEGEVRVSVLLEGHLVEALKLLFEASEVHGSDVAGSVAVDVVVGR